MKCRGCDIQVIGRTHPVAGKTTILADLCAACLESAHARSIVLLANTKQFARDFGHSPEFVREFADWVLTQTTPDSPSG